VRTRLGRSRGGCCTVGGEEGRRSLIDEHVPGEEGGLWWRTLATRGGCGVREPRPGLGAVAAFVATILEGAATATMPQEDFDDYHEMGEVLWRGIDEGTAVQQLE